MDELKLLTLDNQEFVLEKQHINGQLLEELFQQNTGDVVPIPHNSHEIGQLVMYLKTNQIEAKGVVEELNLLKIAGFYGVEKLINEIFMMWKIRGSGNMEFWIEFSKQLTPEIQQNIGMQSWMDLMADLTNFDQKYVLDAHNVNI